MRDLRVRYNIHTEVRAITIERRTTTLDIRRTYLYHIKVATHLENLENLKKSEKCVLSCGQLPRVYTKYARKEF